jgi:hypothetical protein
MMRGRHRQHKSHRRHSDAGMSSVLMGDTAESAEAGAPEIEITPAMIEAGLSAIRGFELIDVWEGHLSRRDLVVAIYRSMTEMS